MLIREGIIVLKRVSAVLCRFKDSFCSDLLLLVVLQTLVLVITLIITQRKPLKIF